MEQSTSKSESINQNKSFEKHAKPNLIYLAGRWVRNRVVNTLLPAGLVFGISGGCVFDRSGSPALEKDANVDARPIDDGSFDGSPDGTLDGNVDAADVADTAVVQENCSVVGDEDNNGLADCEDPVCFDASCAEICDDGEDNNLNGLADCEDSVCFDASCAEICDDGVDNNLDGDTDCAASECSLFENGEIKCAYNNEYEINCIDGIDNNGNGQIDCADAACAITAACGASVEDCFNDESDNGNMWTDCADGTCSLEDVCIENTEFDCTGVPAGSPCPTSLPAPNHTGMCGEEVGLGRVCQPPPGAY